MHHAFNVEIAELVGVNAAIVFENLAFWVGRNKELGINLHEGRYWTYNSRKEYQRQFPYLGEKELRNAFNALTQAGLILVGSFNKLGFDRTLWYTLTEFGTAFGEKANAFGERANAFGEKANAFGERANAFGERTNAFGERANALCQNAEPIPDINTDINADINADKYIAQGPTFGQDKPARYSYVNNEWDNEERDNLRVILSVVEGSCRQHNSQEPLTAGTVAIPSGIPPLQALQPACSAGEHSPIDKLVSRSFVAAAPQDDSEGLSPEHSLHDVFAPPAHHLCHPEPCEGSCRQHNSQEPLTAGTVAFPSVTPPTRAELEREFESLWEHYPRKRGRQKAMESYISLRKKGKASYEQVESGVIAFNESIQRLNITPEFVPYGSRWFVEQRWRDDCQGMGEGGKEQTSRSNPQRSGVSAHGYAEHPISEDDFAAALVNFDDP